MNIRKSKLFAESWNVAIRKKGVGGILVDFDTPFEIIKNNYSSWCADPFLFEYKDATYVFAEIYDYRLRRGVIGYTKLQGEKTGKWIPIIREKYHLSYPFIAEYNGEIYIMPESSENKSLNVYKAIKFPEKWEKVDVLVSDKSIVDTTFFEWNNCIYAFTTDVFDYEKQKEYLIELSGGKVVNLTEIKVDDFNTSRMGGNVFNLENRKIKVCQDCRKTYGGGLIFKEISEDNLDGEMVRCVFPENLSFDKKIQIDGVHTYNANEHYEIIDIKTRRFNILNLVYRVLGKIL